MTSLASTLPEHSNDGYVAAAYIVFFVLVLVYVAIMAIRLGRVERAVRELRREPRQDEETLGRPRERGTV
jgi:ABC-type branched-subunit amino acid transport system permease subunit